jgi:hypothetical protein
LSLEDVNTAIQYAFDDGGRPNVAFCSSAVFSDLQNLLQAKIGYLAAMPVLNFGFTSLNLMTMVGQIPVIPSMYLSNTTASKAIYFLDLSVWEMRVLQDVTFEKLAKTNDSDKFYLKCYEALICRATTFNSSVTGIA